MDTQPHPTKLAILAKFADHSNSRCAKCTGVSQTSPGVPQGLIFKPSSLTRGDMSLSSRASMDGGTKELPGA